MLSRGGELLRHRRCIWTRPMSANGPDNPTSSVAGPLTTWGQASLQGAGIRIAIYLNLILRILPGVIVGGILAAVLIICHALLVWLVELSLGQNAGGASSKTLIEWLMLAGLCVEGAFVFVYVPLREVYQWHKDWSKVGAR